MEVAEEATLPLLKGSELSFKEEFITICKLCGPAMIQLCFQQAVIMSNQSFAGHIGADELAACAIAVTIFNLLWFFILGVSSALDTLSSQAFGANDRPSVVSWSISAGVVMSGLAVPMAVVLYFADLVAVYAFRQSRVVGDLVQIYCRGIIPGLIPFIWALIIIKAMQAQNMMWGPCIVTMAMFVFNIGANMWLIDLYGFTGAAYAQSVSRVALLVFLIVYVATVGRECIQFNRPAWHLPASDEPDADAEIDEALEQANGHSVSGSAKKAKADEDEVPFAEVTLAQVFKQGLEPQRMALFLKLGFAGGMMMFLDASSFDITTAMAGALGVEQVGAHCALLTLCEFIYVSCPYGIATAATIRVGNMLGAGNARAAKTAAWICMYGCAAFDISSMVLVYGFRHQLGYIFTNDKQVVDMVASIAWIAALYQLPDAVYGTLSGVLRGVGLQSQLVWANLAGFWGCGMVVCYVLAFQFGCGVFRIRSSKLAMSQRTVGRS